jgi:uncharacterized protein YjbI with pentapeptide repeats
MDEIDRPATDEDPRFSKQEREKWQAFWVEQGMPWRTEPEIDAARQAELNTCCKVVPDVFQGIYPFKSMKLKREDIEWLLAKHENGRGPVDYADPKQRDRVGLDLRGADLSYAELQNLPLARTIGDVTWRTWNTLTDKQHHMGAVLLCHADLKGAHLEEAGLEYADLDGADLRGCHLEKANLGRTNMLGVYCEEVHLEGADLWFAHLNGAFLWHAYIQGARFYEVHLEDAHLDNLVLANEDQVGPRLADVHWGSANLSVVDWSQMRMLSEEHTACQPKTPDGAKKDRETRIKEFEEAVRANRQLAVALQNQGLNDEASRFVYSSQVLRRKLLALQGGSKLGAYLFSLLLAILTGYGYRMWRILVAYVLLIILFASLYYGFGLSYAPHISWLDASVLSITAFHGRVFSSPFRPDSPQSIVTAIEAIVGFTFEGIFVAMLTQRFFGK